MVLHVMLPDMDGFDEDLEAAAQTARDLREVLSRLI